MAKLAISGLVDEGVSTGVGLVDEGITGQGIDPFRDAPILDNSHLLYAEEAARQADMDFDMSVETNRPLLDIQAFGLQGRPTFKPERVPVAAGKLASRFSDQLFNNTISATVRSLTDPDSSAS